MTTRTITVNTPEQTEVVICDECGLGEDEGELVEFQSSDLDLDTTFHYHRDCARNQTGNPQTLSDAYHEAISANMQYNVAFVLGKMEFNLFAGSVFAFILGAAIAGFTPVPMISPLIASVVAASGLIGMIIVLGTGRDNGKKTAEELI